MDLDFILSYSYNKIPFPFRKWRTVFVGFAIPLIDSLFIDVETLFEGNAVFHDLGRFSR